VDSQTAPVADLKLFFRFAGFENIASVICFPYLLPSYLHYCFSFKTAPKNKKTELLTKHTIFAQPNGKSRTVLAKNRLCDCWTVLTRKRNKGTRQEYYYETIAMLILIGKRLG